MTDPEVEAMGALSGVLGILEEDARGRVLRWAAERYGASIGLAATASVPRQAHGETMGAIDDEVAPTNALAFSHFAELFDAAHPKSDVDKAIVAGYWFQVIQKQPSFQSLQLNTELKHLGHVINNITDAIASNQERKPARIIQLRKSGSSRQARKTFKLTSEGITYVRGMIGHAR